MFLGYLRSNGSAEKKSKGGSISKIQGHKGFTQYLKLLLNLC